jgi:hypothetical protein
MAQSQYENVLLIPLTLCFLQVPDALADESLAAVMARRPVSLLLYN